MGAGGERALAVCGCMPGRCGGEVTRQWRYGSRTAPLTSFDLTSASLTRDQTVRQPLHAGATLSSDALCWPCTAGSFAAGAGELPRGEERHSRIMVEQPII